LPAIDVETSGRSFIAKGKAAEILDRLRALLQPVQINRAASTTSPLPHALGKEEVK